MKLAKSLLLGSAAGLVAVAGASAADLGVKKPTAVEYVKTCPTYGAGFFVVPGTTSCLKLIGRVRADYIFNQQFARTGNKSVFRARGYVGFDHRTATEYGLVRTYVRAYFQRDNATGVGTAPAVTAQTQLEYAFIQFGGLTVGRVTPVFDHGLNGYMLTNAADTTGTIGGMSDIVYVNSIGYTANFGGGFTATLALDSGAERRGAVINNGGVFTASGQGAPDVVAALAYDAAWGSVKLAGAIHETRGTIAAINKDSGKWGYAIQLSGKVNLPFLAKGSNIWASGVIAEGASSYAGYATAGTNPIGTVAYSFSDAVATANGLKLTKAWGVAGGIQAFVTPTVYVGLTGTYASMDPFGAANAVRTASVAGTVGWTPVAGFLIGGEVAYRSIGGHPIAGGAFAAVAGATSVKKHDVVSRIRFQRDF